MKQTRLFFIAIAALLISIYACGGDDNTGSGGDTANNNKNMVTVGVPQEVLRLEFPKVKGGTSEVIVHSTSAYGMTYALEWDHTKRAQRWTCFQIYAGNRAKNWARKNWGSTQWGGDPFQRDPKVPANEQPSVRGEFSGSHHPVTNSYFQRGHICASEDRVYSKGANEQTFYMTNMMPQVPNLNEGVWQKLEARVRTLAADSKTDTLYICKGGTIDRDDQILTRTRSGFIVPRYFFMALLAKNKLGYKAIGFWVEHLDEDHSRDNLANYVVNIDKLEQLTGLDFFCNLPDDIENRVEGLATENVMKAWGFNK